MSIKAKHNRLIQTFLNDENYVVTPSGQIFNKKGRELGFLKKTEQLLRDKQYKYIKYKGAELKIHRIVYAKFKGELKPGYVIHHIDGNSFNNDVNNLDQVSQQENSYYRYYPEAHDQFDSYDNNDSVVVTNEVAV